MRARRRRAALWTRGPGLPGLTWDLHGKDHMPPGSWLLGEGHAPALFLAGREADAPAAPHPHHHLPHNLLSLPCTHLFLSSCTKHSSSTSHSLPLHLVPSPPPPPTLSSYTPQTQTDDGHHHQYKHGQSFHKKTCKGNKLPGNLSQTVTRPSPASCGRHAGPVRPRRPSPCPPPRPYRDSHLPYKAVEDLFSTFQSGFARGKTCAAPGRRPPSCGRPLAG